MYSFLTHPTRYYVIAMIKKICENLITYQFYFLSNKIPHNCYRSASDRPILNLKYALESLNMPISDKIIINFESKSLFKVLSTEKELFERRFILLVLWRHTSGLDLMHLFVILLQTRVPNESKMMLIFEIHW